MCSCKKPSLVMSTQVFAVFHAMLEKLSLIGAIKVDPQVCRAIFVGDTGHFQ